MKQVTLSRPDPVQFTLSDGRSFIVDPCTRGQARAALSLDPKDEDENPSAVQGAEQRARQLAALVGPTVKLAETVEGQERQTAVASEPILASLTWSEEQELLWTLIIYCSGGSPDAAVEVARLLKKKALLILELSASTPSTATPSS